MSEHKRRMTPIAVVGVSALFPGSPDARGFWANILEGRDLITEVPPSHWLVEDYYDPDPSAPDMTYCKRGAFLSSVDFDPMEFGIPPSIVPATDASQILALIVAQKVLEDASGGQFASMDRERISVLLGVTSGQQLLNSLVSRLQRPVWVKALRESGIPEPEVQEICDRIAKNYVPWQESSFPGLLGNVVAGRIANRFDLHGTNAVSDAACASSMSAVSMAVNELQLGQSDLVITGGVDTMNDIFMYVCFSKTPALSPTGDCRPFSDKADGTLLGEGIGMLALKRLEDAERDGDRVYAVIRGIGSSSDGRNKSIYAPVSDGQSRALRRAYAAAGYGPETVELVEAHGTGTTAGDAAEFESLRVAFTESGRDDAQWCALGSVKSQIGHTKAAAGAAGLFKAVMALHHKVLPPTIKVERPNPSLDLGKSPFYLNTQARPWLRDATHPRRASVSSFGFGGSNFHVALEEYVPGEGAARPAWRFRTTPAELILLSAPTPSELVARCRALADETCKDLPRLARESQAGFDPAAGARLAIVAGASELSDRLRQAAASIEKSPDASSVSPAGTSYAAGGTDAGEIAFLFPGQGSQYVGMGADAAMSVEAARAAWDRAASEAFEGLTVGRVVFPPPAFTDEEREAQSRKLTATEWAQPALGAHSASLLGVLRALGVRPLCAAGLSFGEVTALHAAGVFDESALLKIARRRGELMRDAAAAASTPGTMTAVASTVADVQAALNGSGDVIVANYNAPAQCVLSGPVDSIGRVEERLAAKGINFKRLEVSAAFHSPLVASSSAQFRAYLSELEFAAPTMDVYGNADAAVYPRDPEAIRERLAAHITQPVRFVDQVEAMYARGVRTFVEVGAGSVMTELVGRILGGRGHHAVSLERKGRHGMTSLLAALGRLAVAGVALDFGVLWDEYAPVSDKPSKKPAMTLPVSGVNYGKPYPPAGGAKSLPQPNPPRETPFSAPAEPPPETPTPEASRPTTHETPRPAPPEVLRPTAPEVSRPAAPEVTRTVAAAPAPPPELQQAWVQAYQEAQRQTAEAHAAYQRATAESHLAFLKMAEASFAGLSTLLGGGQQAGAAPPAQSHVTINVPPHEVASAPQPAALAPQPYAQTQPAPATFVQTPPAPSPSVSPGEAPAAPPFVAATPVVTTPAATTPVVSAPAASTEPAAPAEEDLETMLLAIVSEKTGYPAEMLAPHMELESDLGIDSIKRVEILSALSERVPGLSDIKMSELAPLRTLGQIADHMRAQGGGAASSNGAGDKTPAPVETHAPAPAETQAHAPASNGNGTIERYALREVAAPAVGMALPGLLSAERVAVTDDGAGLAQLLVARLAERGVRAGVVSEVPADADAVIFLGGMRPVARVDDALAVNREAFRAARAVAARFSTEAGGVFVTVQDTGGDFGLRGADGTRAWLGGVSGLARTAALEWPNASVKAIDCERGARDTDALAEAVCAELFEGGSTLEVGLRADGTRTTFVSEAAASSPAASPRLGPESVVVASGGARGVTAAALIALARAYRPRIVLLGRTPLDAAATPAANGNGNGAHAPADPRAAVAAHNAAQRAREIGATLEALAAAGSPARYLAVDVQDANAVASALDAVRREWGPVTAVVHGAGVLADKRIAEKTDEQFDYVFDTKVGGLRALLAATAGDPLNAICLFSSVAARTGNPGQSDYAMANEVLNLVACAEGARRGGACAVRSIGWGPWEGGMVNPALKSHFQKMGVTLIPLDLGAKVFTDEMNSDGGDVRLVVGGVNGHGPLGAGAAPHSRVEVRVDARSHPYLDDHRIGGVAVAPVVMALEWMLRGARACRPELRVCGAKGVRVLSGIRLNNFDRGGDIFVVDCRQTADGPRTEIRAELRGPGGTLHYSCTVELAAHAPAAPRPHAEPEIGPWTQPEIYDGHVLFHGERFRVIKSVDGISREGVAGTLCGARGVGWPGGSWCTDAAALDGGLQFAGLWTRHVLGGASLPMALGELRTYRGGLVEGDLRCIVRASQVHDARTVCDVSFVDAGGSVVAEVLGVESVLRPDEIRGAGVVASR